MSSPLNSLLSQAYGFIEADQLEDAVQLLKPALADNPNNADAWWLYAHAVENVDDARAALHTVLALEPNYPEAQHLLDMLEEASRGPGMGNPLNDMSLQPIRAIPDFPPAAPELGDDDELAEAERAFMYGDPPPEERKRRAFPWLWVVGLAALFICALVAAFLLSQSGVLTSAPPTVLSEGDITQTMIVLDQTQVVVDITQAAMGVTPEVGSAQTSIDLTTLTAALQATAGEGAQVTVETTSRGQTLVLSVCSADQNVSLRDTLSTAAITLGRQRDVVSMGLDAIGLRLLACDQDSRPLRTLTAAMSDVAAFVQGVIDVNTFEGRLTAE